MKAAAHQFVRRSRPARPCGFMLLEILVILGLLAVAALLSARLYFITGQAAQRANQRQTAQAQFDQALAQLRSDVWQAKSVELKDPHTLMIHDAEETTITWQSSQSLQRRPGGPQAHIQHWPEIGGVLEFEVRGPEVIVIDRSGEPAGQVVLLGESMLLARRQP